MLFEAQCPCGATYYAKDSYEHRNCIALREAHAALGAARDALRQIRAINHGAFNAFSVAWSIANTALEE